MRGEQNIVERTHKFFIYSVNYIYTCYFLSLCQASSYTIDAL